MKKVAATSGHKVNLAAFFFVLEMTWEGNCAGTDMLLNFYSRPPKRRSPSRATLSIPPFFQGQGKRAGIGRIQGLYGHAIRKCVSAEIFSASKQRVRLVRGAFCSVSTAFIGAIVECRAYAKLREFAALIFLCWRF